MFIKTDLCLHVPNKWLLAVMRFISGLFILFYILKRVGGGPDGWLAHQAYHFDIMTFILYPLYNNFEGYKDFLENNYAILYFQSFEFQVNIYY